MSPASLGAGKTVELSWRLWSHCVPQVVGYWQAALSLNAWWRLPFLCCLSALAIPVERRISAQDKLYQSNTQLLISRSLRQCLIQVVLSRMALPLCQARLSVQKWPCFKLVKSEQLGFLWYLSLISLFISPLWRVKSVKKKFNPC